MTLPSRDVDPLPGCPRRDTDRAAGKGDLRFVLPALDTHVVGEPGMPSVSMGSIEPVLAAFRIQMM